MSSDIWEIPENLLNAAEVAELVPPAAPVPRPVSSGRNAERDGTELARLTSVTWADTIEPEPVVWAWRRGDECRIPAGSLSIAAGREGTGKSSFGIWLAAQITRGTLPGSFEGTPRRVLYVAVEDSWKYTLVPRLIAADADRSMVGRFEVVNEVGDLLTLSLPLDNERLKEVIVQHDVGLVVIDPLMSVIGERIDTHRERDVRTALDPLARLADDTGAVVLGIAHFNKGSSTDAASLITGSGAFKNVPRSVFGFARDDSEENLDRVLTQVKNSLGRDDLPSLAYRIDSAAVATPKGPTTTGKFTLTGTSDKTVAEVLRNAGEDHAEARDAATWIKDYLNERGGSAPAKEVISAGREVGYPEKTLKNARSKVATTRREGNNATTARYLWLVHSVGPDRSRGSQQTDVGPTGPTTGPSEPELPLVGRVSGRCTTCSNHVATEGHRPDCDGIK